MNISNSNFDNCKNFINKNELDVNKEKEGNNNMNDFPKQKYFRNNFNFKKKSHNIKSFFNPFNNSNDYLLKSTKNSLVDGYKLNSQRISIQNDNSININKSNKKLPNISKNENSILKAKKIKLKKTNSLLQMNLKIKYSNDINLINSQNRLRNNSEKKKIKLTFNKTLYQYKSEINYLKENLIFQYSYNSKAGKEETGIPKINQDNLLIQYKLLKKGNFSVFAVFDGHGKYGHLVSKYLRNSFENFFNELSKKKQKTDNLEKEIYFKLKNINYLNSIFTKIDENLKKENPNLNNSGSTSLIIIYINQKILCLNIGDSRSIYITKNNKPIQISEDHKPNLKKEKERIIKNGGEIFQNPNNKNAPFRIWNKNKSNYGLAISRSFGDFDVKQIGVICLPDLFEIDIFYSNVKVVILATDGLWEFFTNEDITKICTPFIINNDCDGCCSKLINEAVSMWEKWDYYCDDITVIVIFFK